MANTVTRNLKLRLSPTISSDSRFNLEKIDTLASLYQVDANQTARVRSQGDIVLQPNDADIGGSGVGGTVSIGSIDQPLTSLSFHADTVSLFSILESENEISSEVGFSAVQGVHRVLLAPPATLTADIVLTLPNTAGTANQVLQTDGSGNLSWATLSGLDIGQELAATWSAADGATKTITHGFGTRQVMAQVLDADNQYRTIELEDTTRPDNNSIVFTASSGPAGLWLILLKQIS